MFMTKPPSVCITAALCVITPAMADLALVQEKQCLQCHAVNQTLIGPSFKRIAFRWKGNPTAEKMLISTIQNGTREGGGQHWSATTHMPDGWERPVVSDTEAKKMVEWILRQ
jgi:cytochrome c